MIDTEKFSSRLRARAIDLDRRAILVTNFRGTEQEPDLTEPANCAGFGRIRHFRRKTARGWPENPLPIEPAAQALNLGNLSELKAQVFQNAICNWRCWYCYVPFDSLSASPKYSDWMTCEDLVDLHLAESGHPRVIDLSGGQPDLVPEWIPWMMEALSDREAAGNSYLWSDDNLSNDYFWRYLSPAQIDQVTAYRNYGKVCCFKGYDADSFAFNTGAEPSLFDRQFDLFKRYTELDLDLYAYVTLTSPSVVDLEDKMEAFVERLQMIAEDLPLRTVPLQIRVFTPTRRRLDGLREQALVNQEHAVAAWSRVLVRRLGALRSIAS
ncbi:MAG: hypothetical protein WEB00_05335 [Dehalococcoidia bacterium]